VTIKALMMDVDGVLINGRPGDGRHWQASLQEDFGFSADALREHFFAPHWDDIVVGRADLMERLTAALQTIAPRVSAAAFVSYWFERDSRLVTPLLEELSSLRSGGLRVYLATNQEHLRAAYLMDELGLARYVDGMFYSARLGAKKPDSEFFARAQAAVGVRAEEMLLIDDIAENIEAARRAGWNAMHWTKDSAPESLRTWCA
jgi:putative hydrolase of the HAD superfamily